MNDFHKIFIAIAVILTTAISSCLSDAGNGEESVTKLGLEHSYDEVRNGVRLILAYDMTSNSFNGTVENTTDKILKQVRVEVHLSNGEELGPTTPGDLDPDEKRDIKLAVTSKEFYWWTAHSEVGSGENHREGHSEHEEEDSD